MDKKPETRVNVRVSEEDKEKINSIATRLSVDKSLLVRRAIAEKIARIEHELEQGVEPALIKI